jgi:hypothetical protein
LTSSRNQSAAFAAAFGEARIEFSHKLDGEAWSSWSSINSWHRNDLVDGVHAFAVRSRDFLGNVDSTDAVAVFEVDATPPAPIIFAPTFGGAVRGLVAIEGSAADARFQQYRVDYRTAGSSSWAGGTTITTSGSPATGSALAAWDTTTLPDGSYDLRLSVTDSLGLTGTAQTTVVVDNHAPFFNETAPAKVTAAVGGHVYTTNSETHLYFPPHAFAQDAIIMVTASDAGSVPASLPSGAVKVMDGYELAWSGMLRKPARFTISYGGTTRPPGTLALYLSEDGGSWERLGGTVDVGSSSLSLAVSRAGRYALFADNGVGPTSEGLTALSFSPRVFSPRGSYADTQVGIGFNLGKAGPVTVKVFSLSGRLIREVIAGQQLGAGANLVRWDGRDRDGGVVVDGMYLVTVEALGRSETKTLAVVR